MSGGQWSGLVTNASPFLLPPGAAVEQVNLACRIPGVLRCRGGMRAVAGDNDAEFPDGLADVAAIEIAGEQAVLCMLPDGSVQCVTGPTHDTAPEGPDEPTLAAPAGGVATHYTFTYDDKR